MNKPGILIVGASGHARVVADIVRAEARYEIAGWIDRSPASGTLIDGIPVAGRDEDIPELVREKNITGFVTAIGDNALRAKVTEKICHANPQLEWIAAIHPAASVSGSARIGAGSVIMPGAVVNHSAEVGKGCIVNSHATVEHDCRLGDYASVAPAATLGGASRLGSFGFVGMGAVILHRATIGPDTVVGAGSTVTRDLPAGVVAWGSPARITRTRTRSDQYL